MSMCVGRAGVGLVRGMGVTDTTLVATASSYHLRAWEPFRGSGYCATYTAENIAICGMLWTTVVFVVFTHKTNNTIIISSHTIGG